MGIAQENISETLYMAQSNVSRLEKNSDILLSTLKWYVEGLGGKLNLTAELSNKPPIVLERLGDLMEQKQPNFGPNITQS